MKRVLGIVLSMGMLGAMGILTAGAATNLGLRGGATLITGSGYGDTKLGALVGGELTFGVGGGLDVGGVGEFSTGNSVAYFGGLLRSEISGTGGVFGDLEVGMSAASGSNNFAMGLGLGSKNSITKSLELLPRVGLRYLPTGGGSAVAFDLMVILNFALGPKT